MEKLRKNGPVKLKPNTCVCTHHETNKLHTKEKLKAHARL